MSDSKRLRILSPIKSPIKSLAIVDLDFLPIPINDIGGLDNNVNPDEDEEDRLLLSFFDEIPGTPPNEANEIPSGITEVDLIQMNEDLIQINENLIQKNEEIRRDFQQFKEEFEKRLAKLEEQNDTVVEKHVSDNVNEKTESEPASKHQADSNVDVDSGVEGPESETEHNIIGCLQDDDDDDLYTQNDIPDAQTAKNIIESKDVVTCYACKSPVPENIRKRMIEKEERKMCSYCAAHIYKVVFPSKYNKAFYRDYPDIDISLPRGINLQALMQAAHAKRLPSKTKNTANKVYTILSYKLTDELKSIIMDTYNDFVEKYPIEQGKKWNRYREIGFAALRKHDHNFQPSERHTSLGTNIKKIILDEINKK